MCLSVNVCVVCVCVCGVCVYLRIYARGCDMQFKNMVGVHTSVHLCMQSVEWLLSALQ